MESFASDDFNEQKLVEFIDSSSISFTFKVESDEKPRFCWIRVDRCANQFWCFDTPDMHRIVSKGFQYFSEYRHC